MVRKTQKDVAEFPVNKRCFEHTRSLEMLPRSFSDCSDKSLVSDDTLHITYLYNNDTFCLHTFYDTCYIEPHSQVGEAQKVSPAPTNLQHQTVKFVDAHPGYETSTVSQVDEITSSSFPKDVPLDLYFSRPIRIADFLWNVNGVVETSFEPWDLYFTNPRITNRMSNYRMMRANLKVKIMVNGTPFHYGRIMMSYQPLPTTDGYTVDRPLIVEDVVEASQRPHVWIDPTNSQGGELTLPFFWNENGLDLATADFTQLGRIRLFTVNPLKHALGKTAPVNITVFAWAEDVHYSIPTKIDMGGIVPQAEYTKGPVERAATTVASAASTLTEVPFIAPYAKATTIAAQAAAEVSSLFGLSNPPQLESSRFQPVAKKTFANTNGLDDVEKLTLDPKSETTLDTRPMGLEGDDELVISKIASRQSFLTLFNWSRTATSNSLLFSAVVDPGVRATRNSEMHFPALCYASMPFKFWRGTIKYRFQVICSKYHKGRLAVVWDPIADLGTSPPEYDTNYTTVVDISDTTDFEVEVGWGQTTQYREHFPVRQTTVNAMVPQTSMFNTSALTYTANTVPYGNGVLSVYVLNELAVPDETIDSDISVNVFVSGGDDFEVAVPVSTYLNMLITSTASLPKNIVVEPQAEIMSSVPTEEHDRVDSAPNVAPQIDRLGPLTLSPKINDVYFGESVRSFRSLLKRYNICEFIPATLTDTYTGLPIGTQVISRIGRESMPFEYFWSLESSGTTADVVQVAGGNFVYAFMTVMRYLTLGFGGWRGCIRQCIIASNNPSDPSPDIPVTLSWRSTPCANYLNASIVNSFWDMGERSQYYGSFWDNEGMSGSHYISKRVNPVGTIEVPYNTPYKFAPAKQLPRFTEDVTTAFNTGLTNEPGKVYFEITTQTSIRPSTASVGPDFIRLVAAGEDFNLFYYLGPPIFFFRASMPTTFVPP